MAVALKKTNRPSKEINVVLSNKTLRDRIVNIQQLCYLSIGHVLSVACGRLKKEKEIIRNERDSVNV